MTSKSIFTRMAKWTAHASGHPFTFIGAVALIILWLMSGPLFGFSDTWQLVVNTATTIITFLMVFLIQSTQNRDTAAIQIKLDELIRAFDNTHNALMDLEELDERELQRIRTQYCQLASIARRELRERGVEDAFAPDADNKPPTT